MLEIFEYGFLLRSFSVGLIISIIAPLIGMFLVVRRYSLLADTLAHVSLTGVAIGLITKINPVIMAIVVSSLSVIGIEKLKSSKMEFGESLLALFLWGGMATAIVIISLGHGFNTNLYSYLFGSILSVSITDLYLISGLGIVTIIIIGLFFKELFLISFDEEQAKIGGLNVRIFNYLLLILSAITVSLSMRVVGVILVGALMVIPVITAIRLSQNFIKTLFIAIGLSIFSLLTGMLLSYYFDLVSGGSIVLVNVLMFIVILPFSRKRGMAL